MEDCASLGLATRGCDLVILTATDIEAEPIAGWIHAPELHVVATKRLLVGWAPLAPGLARGPVSKKESTGRGVRTVLAVGGCGKTNTAHVLTFLLQAMAPKPLLVLQAGIAGAFVRPDRNSKTEVGDIVLATRETYSDMGSSSPAGLLSAAELGLPVARVGARETGGEFALNLRLVEAAARVIEAAIREYLPKPWPKVVTGPCVTSSRITGVRKDADAIACRWGAVAESMEGAAAAHICAFYGVPFLESRGISNLVVDRERHLWEVDRAVAAASLAARAVAAALDRLPLADRRPRESAPQVTIAPSTANERS